MFANQRLFNTILIDAFCHSSKHIETGALDLLKSSGHGPSERYKNVSCIFAQYLILYSSSIHQ